MSFGDFSGEPLLRRVGVIEGGGDTFGGVQTSGQKGKDLHGGMAQVDAKGG